jgi:hypothetical protein
MRCFSQKEVDSRPSSEGEGEGHRRGSSTGEENGGSTGESTGGTMLSQNTSLLPPLELIHSSSSQWSKHSHGTENPSSRNPKCEFGYEFQ